MVEPKDPTDILNFWFGDYAKTLWFKKNDSFDREIKNNFLTTYELAASGKLDSWKNEPQGILALIILLDQFPRNMFRNSARAFSTDKKGVKLTKYALEQNFDRDLSPEKRAFLYMPLMHSEELENQDKCVELYQKLGKEDNFKYAIKHRDVIARFGRFPHRNAKLNRESTAAELEFLAQPGSSF